MSTAIKEHRQALGLSQEATANRARISVRYYRLLEAGESTPSLPIARRVAGALGVDVDAVWPPETFDVPAAEAEVAR